MSKPESPLRKKAQQLWIKSGRTMKPKEIAEQLGISSEMVRKWKHVDGWERKSDSRRGAPRGNKNAKGNKGGGAPPNNDNAVKHGAYRKFLPEDPEYLEILDMVQEMDTLDMIYQGIETSFVAFIRMEKIMHVTGKDEMIKELKKRKFEVQTKGRGKDKEIIPVVTEEEYEFQFAWDRYATYAKTQSVILTQLRAGIKQFLNAAPENDERRMKLELMQAQIAKAKSEVDKAGKMEHTVIFKGGEQLED